MRTYSVKFGKHTIYVKANDGGQIAVALSSLNHDYQEIRYCPGHDEEALDLCKLKRKGWKKIRKIIKVKNKQEKNRKRNRRRNHGGNFIDGVSLPLAQIINKHLLDKEREDFADRQIATLKDQISQETINNLITEILKDPKEPPSLRAFSTTEMISAVFKRTECRKVVNLPLLVYTALHKNSKLFRKNNQWILQP